ncbi:hypothetical protein FRC07_003112, partial [Ceratobasidium sp. 392]
MAHSTTAVPTVSRPSAPISVTTPRSLTYEPDTANWVIQRRLVPPHLDDRRSRLAQLLNQSDHSNSTVSTALDNPHHEAAHRGSCSIIDPASNAWFLGAPRSRWQTEEPTNGAGAGPGLENNPPRVVACDYVALAPRLPPLLAGLSPYEPHHDTGLITGVENNPRRVTLATTAPRLQPGITEPQDDARVTPAVLQRMRLSCTRPAPLSPSLTIPGVAQTRPNSPLNNAGVHPSVLSHPPRVVARESVALAPLLIDHLTQQWPGERQNNHRVIPAVVPDLQRVGPEFSSPYATPRPLNIPNR